MIQIFKSNRPTPKSDPRAERCSRTHKRNILHLQRCYAINPEYTNTQQDLSGWDRNPDSKDMLASREWLADSLSNYQLTNIWILIFKFLARIKSITNYYKFATVIL